MIQISQIKLSPDHNEKQFEQAIRKALRLKQEPFRFEIVKRSIDARKKEELSFVYTVLVEIAKEEQILKKSKNKNAHRIQLKKYDPYIEQPKKCSPIIIGTGPAGLFCGYLFALNGQKPIFIERGSKVEDRAKTIEEFWKSNVLNEECNVQFGEGGAGTFSDGKLNTSVKDKNGLQRFILETFVQFGAPEDILYLNKPHIGTDYLRIVIANMRKEMIKLGATFYFNEKVTKLLIKEGRIVGVETSKEKQYDAEQVVLAIGHSARDTFEMLKEKEVNMEPKAFAIGVRMEHPAQLIDEVQYKGAQKQYELPTADYKVTYQTKEGRGVYSFCMCPGGYVVNASSEQGRIVVNGMSNHKRDARNSNAAIIVNVTPDDFYHGDVLDGVAFQQQMEEKAYKEGEGKIPVQLFGDFCKNKVSTGFGEIVPEIKGQYHFGRVSACLPKEVSSAIIEGVFAFEKRIAGFAREDSVLSGVETRTSSPIRIVRDEDGMSNIKGLYPCGEGAGYAGGIMSAAMDGCKTANGILKSDGGHKDE